LGASDKIWLKISLTSSKLFFVVSALLLPVAVSAGFISFLTNLISEEEFVVEKKVVTSRNMKLLEANRDSVSTSSFADAVIINDGVIIQETGANVSDVNNDYKSTQISRYVVRKGDTLSSIAKMYNVSVNTIVWANEIKGTIHEGDALVILPVTGVTHIVKKGDTLKSLSAKYKADMG